MGKSKKWFAFLLVFAMLLTTVGGVPADAKAAKLKTVTVGTQKELEAALKSSEVGKIVISTKDKVTFTIPKSKESSSKSLVINATNATISNNGSFKGITIVASTKFTENGKGNAIVIKEKNADFTVSSKAVVKSVISNGSNSNLKFDKGASIDTIITNGISTTIALGNDVKAKKVTLKGKDASLTLAKGATIVTTEVAGLSANLTVAKGATIKTVEAKKKGAKLDIVANGTIAIDILAKATVSLSGAAKTTVINIDKKAESTVLEASTAIKLDTKAGVDITLKAGAENSTLKVSDNSATVSVKNDTKKNIILETTEGAINVGIGEKIKKEANVTATPTATPTAAPSDGGGSTAPGNTTPTRVPVDQNGFDSKGRMVAYFGTPSIDGTVDKVWENAEPVTVKDSAGKTDTSAEFRVLWDDSALYVLAKVKDSALDSSNGSVYEKDSVEIFLDEKNNKSKDYGVDDLHFRVNYKNEQSADNGDLSKFYTSAKTVSDGYVVEARIALTDIPVKNQKVYGLELQINDAKGGKRITSLQLFDKTGMAYADTGLFGEVLCVGKTADSVSGLNPYDLMKLVANSKKIMLERYTNGNVVRGLIADSEAALANVNTTQKKIDDLYAALNKAVENLISDGKDYDIKECRDVPLKYKTIDEHKGTVERVNYTTNSYDAKNETREKDFLVYLPYGYNAADKSKKYDVLYLLHGYGENQNTVFGGPGQNTEMMKILDNMIYDGKLKPLIIVTPTYSYKGVYDFNYIGLFHNELVNDIIPKVEANYNTYAASTSEKDLIAAREHRALGGFSMGSMTTWNTFVNRVEYFKYYMPVSGAFSNDGGAGVFNGTAEEKTAQYLESVIKEGGYTPNDVSIFCATGTDDFASGGMVNMVNAMKKYDDTFLYTANLNKGNFYFINSEGGTHSWNSVNKYLYNVLPDMFNSKKITLDAPSPIAVNDKGFDTEGRMVANFGTPSIDGAIDPVWDKAVQITASNPAKTPVEAKFKMLWDDKAVYLLAEIKDSQLNGTATNVYDRDSVEIFLDENHDKTVKYGTDDLHFRVSYDNKQSADNGDLSRFYTKTSVVNGGYIVEARISLLNKPANDQVFGIDLSVNDGKNGSKVGSVAVFDQNNEAYKDTSKFGAILLSGRARGSVSGLNPYDLMNVVAEGKQIKLERYTNGDVVKGLITDSEIALGDVNVTQKTINNLYKKLRAAIDGLIPDGKSYDEKECRMIPSKYRTVDEHQGTIERVAYTTNSYDSANETLDKDMLVYLPAGYDKNDKTKKYNVLYLIHGLTENQNTVFGGPGENTELMKIIDNMIYNGQLEPMIIVTPTWAYKGDSDYMAAFFRQQPANFNKELVKDIIPKIESTYNTYAASTSETDLIAARDHRAVAGFSMGSSATWYTYINQIKYFKYYMPMSLSCQVSSGLDMYQGTLAEKRAQYLEKVAEDAGYGPNDFSIFGATGTEDALAYADMAPQMEAMKKLNTTFMNSADLTKGNFYFLLMEGGTHTWNCVNRYLYNMLPDLFNDKKIDPATIPVKAIVSFDKNDGTGIINTKKASNGAVKLLTATEVKVAGAELVGWSTTADAKDIVTPEIDGTYKVTKSTTLYAIWKWSKPSVVSEVTSGAVSVDTTAAQDIKLAIGVSGAAITVSGGAITVSGGAIIANLNEDFTLNVTKNVSSSVTGNYIIQYAAVDINESDMSKVIWNDVTFTDNNAMVNVAASSVDRKIFLRVVSGEGGKFLNSDEVLLETKN